MEVESNGIDRVRQILIERMEAFRDDPSDERLEELEAALELWKAAARNVRN